MREQVWLKQVPYESQSSMSGSELACWPLLSSWRSPSHGPREQQLPLSPGIEQPGERNSGALALLVRWVPSLRIRASERDVMPNLWKIRLEI